jgi:hypothetical protein
MSLDFAPLAKKHFSLQRILLCALPLLVLLLWIVALSGLAAAGGTATADAPARVFVQIPPAAKSASVVMLEITIAVSRKGSAGHLGAVVRLRPSAGAAVEVGRVSIGENGSYQFNIGRALGPVAGGSAEVEVSVIDRAGAPAPAGAALSIGRAQIVTR